MARPLKGKVIPRQGADGLTHCALRFTAYGKRRYLTLGAISEEDAETRMRHILVDIERGIWQPPAEVELPVEAVPPPTLHVYAEEWWLRNERRLGENTRLDYRWRLESHLLPYFKDMRLDAVGIDAVEDYIAAKLAEENPLSARSINMTLTLLGAILETAVERELIPRNPAVGKRRRVRERSPQRSYLHSAAQIRALLVAAGELDRTACVGRRHIRRHAMLATLVFSGLRIGELCELRWRNIDLEDGWLTVADAKTDAGVRRVKIRPALLAILRALRQLHPDAEPDDYVFPSVSGGALSDDNVRNRVLKAAVRRADRILSAHKLSPLPPRITPHSLRRTFVSILYALGEDPGVIMDEIGHTDPSLALRIYRQSMRRGEQEKAELHALVERA